MNKNVMLITTFCGLLIVISLLYVAHMGKKLKQNNLAFSCFLYNFNLIFNLNTIQKTILS